MTSNLDILCGLLEATRRLGADAADGIMVETSDVSSLRRMGKPEGLERSETKAIGLRAFFGHKQAIASSTDTHPDALKELAARAVSMAKAATPDPDSRLATGGLLAKNLPKLDLYDAKEPPLSWLAEQCQRAEEAALSVKGITNSEGSEAHYGNGRVSLATSGSDASFAQEYQTSQFSISVSVLGGENTDMQRDYDFTSAHHRADLKDAHDIGISAGERTIKRLNPRRVASQQVPVVFDPRVSRNLVSTFASAISGSSIARGSSFLKDAMGTSVFAPNVTITDDPHRKRGLGSKPFDGEGVAGKKLTLIENGVLKTWLLDVRTAHKLGLVTTGHASRGIASPPSPSSTNLTLGNGTLTAQELMSDIKNGLYLTETFGMGVNIVTGDYSQGASGFWIENGEIAYPVSEITIAGKLQDMFARLVPANDLEYRYATNAPTVRVEGMTIAGT